jgi:hypothetical protein
LKSTLHLNLRRNQNSVSSNPSSFLTINTWFLATATWTFPPALPYLQNLNISRLHDVLLFVWKLHAGVRNRKSITATREGFIKMM